MSDSRKSLKGKDVVESDQPPGYHQTSELERLSYLSRLSLQPTAPAVPDFSTMTPAEQSRYFQIQKLQSMQEEIGTAQRTNQMLSQHMALISKPAMLPHYLSLEITSKDGNVSSKAILNPTRIQCVICKEWFFNRDAYLEHKRVLPHDCEDCSKCFRDNIHHAEHFRHTRCFVTRCMDTERSSYNWSEKEIKAHVCIKHHVPVEHIY